MDCTTLMRDNPSGRRSSWPGPTALCPSASLPTSLVAAHCWTLWAPTCLVSTTRVPSLRHIAAEVGELPAGDEQTSASSMSTFQGLDLAALQTATNEALRDAAMALTVHSFISVSAQTAVIGVIASSCQDPSAFINDADAGSAIEGALVNSVSLVASRAGSFSVVPRASWVAAHCWTCASPRDQRAAGAGYHGLCTLRCILQRRSQSSLVAAHCWMCASPRDQ